MSRCTVGKCSANSIIKWVWSNKRLKLRVRVPTYCLHLGWFLQLYWLVSIVPGALKTKKTKPT
jgi:hypothetical protein